MLGLVNLFAQQFTDLLLQQQYNIGCQSKSTWRVSIAAGATAIATATAAIAVAVAVAVAVASYRFMTIAASSSSKDIWI